jgi:hypothetical protein
MKPVFRNLGYPLNNLSGRKAEMGSLVAVEYRAPRSMEMS